MNTALSTLTDHQRQVVQRALAEESAKRRHLVISLSGAHAYGFPSPDSDVDLKAVHVVETRSLLGLNPRIATGERLEVIDGVEFDYSTNELGAVFASLLKGNGNYFERFLSRFVVEEAPEVEALRPLVKASLSRQIGRHYRGFATTQRAAWEQGGRTSAKKLLYVLRTLLTGTHALRTAEVETDLSMLAPQYGLEGALELIEQKRRGEKSELPTALSATWASKVDGVFALLDDAEKNSPLPVSPSHEQELDEALISFRLNAGSFVTRA